MKKKYIIILFILVWMSIIFFLIKNNITGIKEDNLWKNLDNSLNINKFSPKLLANYNKLLLKDKNKAKKLIDWLSRKEISEKFFELSLEYLLWNKKFTKENETVIKNLNYFITIVKNPNIWSYECDAFRYFFYILDTKKFDEYHIYNMYLPCYKNMVNNLNFIKDPINNDKLLETNNINKYIYDFKKWIKIPENVLKSDPRLLFLITDDNKPPSREEFKNLLNNFTWFQNQSLNEIYLHKFILARIWIDIFYDDISSYKKNIFLSKIKNNFYDYLLIDRSIFRNKNYCEDIINKKIQNICKLALNKNNLVDERNTYENLIQEYLIYMYNYN